MTKMQNRFFFHISADLASITAAKNLKFRKSYPKTVYGNIGADV